MKRDQILALAASGLALSALLAACGGGEQGAVRVEVGGSNSAVGASPEADGIDTSPRLGKTATQLGVDLAKPAAYADGEGSCLDGVERGVVISESNGGSLCVGKSGADGAGTEVRIGRSGVASAAIAVDRCTVEAASNTLTYNIVRSDSGPMLIGVAAPGVASVAIEADGGGRPILTSTFTVPDVDGLTFYATSVPSDWKGGVPFLFDAKGDPVLLQEGVQAEGCWR